MRILIVDDSSTMRRIIGNVVMQLGFTKDSFDKDKFTKIMKDKREKNQELHADVIDKAYKVLDSKQKEQLRTLLDLRKEKMKQRFED